MPTTIGKIPEEVEKYYSITLLGKPYTEMVNDNGRVVIKYGYIYKGVKYYEREMLPRERIRLSGECDVCGNHTLECTCKV